MRKEIFPHSFLGATCVIKVKDIGEMIVLRIIGDGNCQFRAISTIHDVDGFVVRHNTGCLFKIRIS